jgi:hypothetical protein
MNAARRRRTRLLLGASALVLAGSGMAACGTTTSTTATDAATTETTPVADASAPAPAPTETPTVAESASPTPTVKVPVYYVVATPEGQKLVEEQHEVPQGHELEGALAALGTPTDPDYRSYYAAGDLGSATYDGDKFTVSLQNTKLEDQGGLTKADATIAVQQLVYTLDAVQQSQGAPTTVVAGSGDDPVSLYGIDTRGGVDLGDQIDTLALVNVLSPASNSSVSGSLDTSGLASSFEGNVPWTITDADGTVVKKGFATAEGWMDRLYPWSKKIDVSSLEPGDYTFTAMTDDPSGGSEGKGPTKDTKKFTIS